MDKIGLFLLIGFLPVLANRTIQGVAKNNFREVRR